MEPTPSPLSPRLPAAALRRVALGAGLEALATTALDAAATPTPVPTQAADAATLRDQTATAPGARAGRVPPPLPDRAPSTPVVAPAVPPARTDAPSSAPIDRRTPAAPIPQPLRFAADAARASLAAGRPLPALALLDAAWPAEQAPAEMQALRAQGLLDVGRETEGAEVAARGIAQNPESSALRWIGAQAAARLDAPQHAAALLLPLLRQVPVRATTPAQVAMSADAPEADGSPAPPREDVGVPAKARGALRGLVEAVVTLALPVKAPPPPAPVELPAAAAADVPLDAATDGAVQLQAVAAESERGDAAPRPASAAQTSTDAAAPGASPTVRAGAMASDAASIAAPLVEVEWLDVEASGEAVRDATGQVASRRGEPVRAAVEGGEPADHPPRQVNDMSAARGPVAPASSAAMDARSSRGASAAGARTDASSAVSTPGNPAPISPADSAFAPPTARSTAAATTGGAAAAPAPAIAAPSSASITTAGPSAPEGTLAARPMAPPASSGGIAAGTTSAPGSAVSGVASSGAASPVSGDDSIAPAEAAPPRLTMFEIRRSAVLAALEAALPPTDRRQLQRGSAVEVLERWLAGPMRPPHAPTGPSPLPPLSSAADGPVDTLVTDASQMPEDVDFTIESLQPPRSGAPVDGRSYAETTLRLGSGEAPRTGPSGEPGREGESAPTEARTRPADVPVTVPSPDPATLFAWLSVDARVQPAGLLAASWRQAGEQAVLQQVAGAAAAMPSPIPVSWQGVLRLAMLGSALVLMLVGREMTAAIVGMAAVWWWLRSRPRGR